MVPAILSPPFARRLLSERVLWICLGLIAVNLVVYSQVWRYEFLAWDDPYYVTENPNVTEGLTWRGVWWALRAQYEGNWFPLTRLSHMLDVQLYGLHAGAHHLTSLLLHIANTLLLFGVLRRMTGAAGRSAFVAALFAVHPLHVESVAWVAERKDVLSTLFWMLTLWAYVSYVSQFRSKSWFKRYTLVLLLFSMGLMAKPMLVTLPFLLLLLDFWPLGRVTFRADGPHSAVAQGGERSRTTGTSGGAAAPGLRSVGLDLVLEKVPLLGLAAASSILTFAVQQKAGSTRLDVYPLDLRAANAAVSYVAYIGKMLWPSRLAAFYPFPRSIPEWYLIGSLLVLIGVSVVAIRAARRRPYLLVGWLWYLGTLVPVIGLVQVGDQAMADRYTYIPLIGLFIMAAWGIPDLLAKWPYRSIALPAAAALLILVLTVIARTQAQHWRNGVALWEHGLEVTTENYLAHNNLGVALANEGRVSEAVAHYTEALRLNPAWGSGADPSAQAPRVNSYFAHAYNGLGKALADKGKISEAIAHYTEALRLNPYLAEAHNNLGFALANQGRVDDAMAQYSEALRLRPNYPEARRALEDLMRRAKSSGAAIP
jgi:tetratricopeptide (TPR) repeat protein